MSVRALQYIRAMEHGWTQPHLLKCDDGRTYVVKFMNNRDGMGVLANEWIAYRLGQLLGLPIAKCTIVYVTRDLVDIFPVLKNMNVRNGPHLGSIFASGGMIWSEQIDLGACKNVKYAADMIVFDHWINNWDRHQEMSNLLYVEEQQKLLLIDHSDAFFGPEWNQDEFLENPDGMEAFWGPMYEMFVPFIDGPDPFGPALNRLESLEEKQLVRAMRGLPKQWAISSEDMELLVQFLMIRKDQVGQTLQELKEYFPIWRETD